MTADRGDAHTAVRRLARAHRALITGHQRPDGDSLGSQLALAELAGALGVAAVIVNHDPAPSTLAELPGTELVTVGEALPGDFPDGFDLVVAVECPRWSGLGSRASIAGRSSTSTTTRRTRCTAKSTTSTLTHPRPGRWCG
jgi:phosphoesterase RecJ-like protein